MPAARKRTDFKWFTNEEFGTLRAITINGEQWFVGADAATMLGFRDFREVLRNKISLSDKQVLKKSPTSMGVPNYGITIINKHGLSMLIKMSRRPLKQRIAQWIESEVIQPTREITVSTGSGEAFVNTYFPEVDGTTKALFNSLMSAVNGGRSEVSPKAYFATHTVSRPDGAKEYACMAMVP